MKVSVDLENGFLPDRFGKYAPERYQIDDHPIRSFPIRIEDVPMGTKALALAFVDFDAIPVGGFCWIHWLACNIDPQTTVIPENASAEESIPMVQGSNSDFSSLAGGHTKKDIVNRYAGPYPPDKDHMYTLYVYALDASLPLEEGYYLNEFRRLAQGHILECQACEFLSRS